MDAIVGWLKGKRPYTEGVQLYAVYGNDLGLKRLFLEEWTEFKGKKLEEAMMALCNSKQDKTVLDNSAKNIESDIDDHDWRINNLEGDIQDGLDSIEQLQKDVEHLKFNMIPKGVGWPQVMDETLRTLHATWLILFSEKKNLQARIYDVALAGEKDAAKKKEAGAMACRILELRDQCKEIYNKRDYYLQHTKLPEEMKLIDIPDDPKKFPLTLQNFQRYARDYKNKLKKQPQNASFQKQLEKYEWGIKELKRLMDVV